MGYMRAQQCSSDLHGNHVGALGPHDGTVDAPQHAERVGAFCVSLGLGTMETHVRAQRGVHDTCSCVHSWRESILLLSALMEGPIPIP